MHRQLALRPWPAKLPDISCLEFWFWGVAALEEVRKIRLSTLSELKAVVEAFAEIVDLEEMKSSAKST